MLSNSHLKNIHILFHSGSMEKIKRDSAYLSSSGHDRFPSKQFRKNTTSTPQVNCRAILCYTEQKLGGPIPKRHNPASQLLPLIRVKNVARPKSAIFSMPLLSIKRFAPLISRCRTPHCGSGRAHKAAVAYNT